MKHVIVIFAILFLIFPLSAKGRSAMEIIYVPEMATMDEIEGRVSSRNQEFHPLIISGFHRAWKNAMASISQKIDEKTLHEISRWCKKEMKDFHLPKDWINQIFLVPEAVLNNQTFFFFHDVPNGIPLPSHHPLVFRRMMVGAVYDPLKSRITKVVFTIKGWIEE